jgi:hypothetical protein
LLGSVFFETGATFSLILKHVSASSGAGGIFSVGGSAHNLQGFPGHRHPLHFACAAIAGRLSNNARKSGVIRRKTLIECALITTSFFLLRMTLLVRQSGYYYVIPRQPYPLATKYAIIDLDRIPVKSEWRNP